MKKTALWHRVSALVFALSFGVTAGAAAQDAAQARAQSALPPEVYRGLSTLATELASDGIPSGPLYAKALEGMAKGVPMDMLLPAVRSYGGRLGQARGALGPGATTPLLVAAVDAMQRGVPADALSRLPNDRPRSPVAILVLADLIEDGVPHDRAIQVLRQSMDQRLQDDRMLRIPARVRRLIRDGVPPHEAIERVRRALRRDRGGHFGPAIPLGDQSIADRQLLYDRLRISG